MGRSDLYSYHVHAVYTNIPHEEGIQKLIKFLKRHNALDNEIPLIQHLLPHILEKKYCEFNNETFQQASGTTMGTRCPPNYVIIFMAEQEEEFLQQSTLKLRLWLRFIDDTS